MTEGDRAQPAPAESTDVFRRLAASSPIGILLFDTDGRLTFANERWRETVGVGPDEVVRDFEWIDFIHPDDRERVLAEAERAGAGDGSMDLEFRFVSRDGETRWIRCRWAPVRDPGRGLDAFVATSEDVTTERETAESQRRLTQALETTPDFVVILEADGRVVYANEAVRQQAALFGNLDPGALMTRGFFTDDSWETIRDEAWPALEKKGEWQGELTVRRPDGVEVPMIQSARAHRDEDGEIQYISGIARDISEIRRFEAQLAENGALFRALVERSHDLVALFDREGHFAYASPSHARVLGYLPSELLGRSALDLLHPDDRKRAVDTFASQIQGDAPTVPVEQRHRHRDGSYRWLESVAQNRLDDPRVQGIVVNARDITERKRAEQLAAEEARILEQVARGAPLADSLAAIVAMVESVLADCVGAVVARVGGSTELEVLAAPGLASATVRALETDPAPRPPRPLDDVFVRDLEQAREAASEARRALLADGFRTVWTARLRSAAGEPLGGLLVLRHDRQAPSSADHRLLSLAGHVAAIAIARDREVKGLARAARRDPLTGLPNRTEAIERLAALEPGDAWETAVLFLDLDRFKLLNDGHGHVAGDGVLVEIGRRLRTATRPADLVARLGGDEFLCVCEHLTEPDEAVAIAERVLRVVREPIFLGSGEVVVTTSIGIAMGRTGGPQAALTDADAAMYLAKARGRNRVEMFEEPGVEPAGG